MGVTVDEKLNFSKHIENVSSKLAKNARILYRIRDSLPLSARLHFYYAFVYPYLSYNVIIWGGCSSTHIKPIITLHKRIIRTMCNSQRLDHSSPLFRNLKLLKFEDIYKYSMCIHMHKAIADGQFGVNHDRNTRNNNLASSEFHGLTICQRAVSYRGPLIWNSLPLHLRTIESLPSFKNKLKLYFLSHYL